jgi:outer membrane lipoprotein carrier protein
MKTFSLILFLTLVVVAPTYGAEAPATQPAEHRPTTRASDELLNRVQDDLKTVESVEADFSQEERLKLLKHSLKISGHFALQKPAKLVWIVDKPVKYAIKVEGDELRQWDEDTNKVQVVHLGGDPTFKAITEQLQSWFLGDYKSLAANYDVYLESESPLTLGFTPKAGTMVASVLEHVDLIFGVENKYLDRMIIREAGGDVTTLNYLNTKINQPIDKSTWEIPPHGR